MGASGWLVLAEELPLKQHFGVVRVAAPLAGSNVCKALIFPCSSYDPSPSFSGGWFPCSAFPYNYVCLS